MLNSVHILLIACLILPTSKSKTNEYKFPNYAEGRNSIIHLFEWKWKDIATECEKFLGPRGFGGVQVSPPNENLIIWEENRPWWERYQPVSYRLITRSGNEKQFMNMVRRCNTNDVRIYVDAVINHMTGKWKKNYGTGGSKVNFTLWSYPAVPYSSYDFHWPYCVISKYDHRCCPRRMRNCELNGLKDLNHGTEYVRSKIIEYMNRLIGMGVAGFRIDAAKHMWPSDLEVIYDNLDNLNTSHGFPPDTRPYIYHDVADFGGEMITSNEYTTIGAVTEYKYGLQLSRAFHGLTQLNSLENIPSWDIIESDSALSFIDSHVNQRELGADRQILTYKQQRNYVAAVAFMLAYPYGNPRIMSSFDFHNTDSGPPMDKNGQIKSPKIKSNGSCSRGWICEHRWRQIYNMVGFRNVAGNGEVTDWWDNGGNQIAFCRGAMGFIAFNNEITDLDEHLQTCLESGIYCDIISGENNGSNCTGRRVSVRDDGKAHIIIGANEKEMVFAIHAGIDSKLGQQ